MSQHAVHPETLLAHSGRAQKMTGGTVNIPVYRASTLLFPTVDAMRSVHGTPHTYGRHGNPCLNTHAIALRSKKCR
ncbi:MAG: PLP-dependent transferase [Proteobacteria bacterium]|nr:PLP-dependent transferase [Pseudomonadota bacterium]